MIVITICNKGGAGKTFTAVLAMSTMLESGIPLSDITAVEVERGEDNKFSRVLRELDKDFVQVKLPEALDIRKDPNGAAVAFAPVLQAIETHRTGGQHCVIDLPGGSTSEFLEISMTLSSRGRKREPGKIVFMAVCLATDEMSVTRATEAAKLAKDAYPEAEIIGVVSDASPGAELDESIQKLQQVVSRTLVIISRENSKVFATLYQKAHFSLYQIAHLPLEKITDLLNVGPAKISGIEADLQFGWYGDWYAASVRTMAEALGLKLGDHSAHPPSRAGARAA